MQKLLFFLLLIPFCATAQKNTLLVQGASPGLYMNHKVLPKENYYSIGRIYNISPKEIAPYNNLQMESGLSLGQILKIPLSTAGFFQSGVADGDETFVPVYYAVKDKEGLYRVAQNHNDLPLKTLKQWNNIKGDAVKKGTVLIVGYLKVKKDLSALAKYGIGSSITSNAVAAVKAETKPVAAEKQTEEKKPVETVAAAIPKKEEIKLVKPVVTETKVEKNEPVKQVKDAAVKETQIINEPVNNIPGGVFKTLYETQTKNTDIVTEEGTGGIFKSTSGFADKKYYCLHNKAAAGTVIKIINPTNGKFVYAKVVDLVPDIKQNSGMLIIISNAAAEELGAAENNFTCLLNYPKN